MIEAVIFDCFGVLVSDGWLPFKAKYFGTDAVKFQEATDLNKSVDAGLISYDAFIAGIAELANIPKASVHEQIEQNPPNMALFEYIATLKPNYKIGLLSNAGDNWLEQFFTPGQLSLFDASVLSYQIGTLKPHAEAYQAVTDRLGVSPEACIFIDDQERYCSGAEAVGMRAVQFTDNESCIAATQAILQAT